MSVLFVPPQCTFWKPLRSGPRSLGAHPVLPPPSPSSSFLFSSPILKLKRSAGCGLQRPRRQRRPRRRQQHPRVGGSSPLPYSSFSSAPSLPPSSLREPSPSLSLAVTNGSTLSRQALHDRADRRDTSWGGGPTDGRRRKRGQLSSISTFVSASFFEWDTYDIG